jgi:hypothetical protein
MSNGLMWEAKETHDGFGMLLIMRKIKYSLMLLGDARIPFLTY